MTSVVTHRSLNKLEFKAHQSIHDFVEVSAQEAHESAAYTRDRLGKKHPLMDRDGAARVGKLRKKTAAAALALLFLGGGVLFAGEPDAGYALTKKKGPNAQVTSRDPEVSSMDRWMNRQDEKPIFYQNGPTAVGFNDDGDPNVSTRF